MPVCQHCNTTNPPAARFCMRCGQPLEMPSEGENGEFRIGGMSLFTLSIVGSIVLSLILMGVFRLPVFFLAAFLPLLWWGRGKNK